MASLLSAFIHTKCNLWTGLWSSGELGTFPFLAIFFPKQRACSQVTHNAPVEIWTRQRKAGVPTITVFVEFCWHCIKTWGSSPNFYLFPSSSSVSTDNRKQFQCLNIALNNKTRPVFLKFSWCEKRFWFLIKKVAKKREKVSLCSLMVIFLHCRVWARCLIV